MRDDLQAIEPMEAAGWLTIYSAADKRWERTNWKDPASVPHDRMWFVKDNKQVYLKQRAIWGEDSLVADWWLSEAGEDTRITTIEEACKL